MTAKSLAAAVKNVAPTRINPVTAYFDRALVQSMMIMGKATLLMYQNCLSSTRLYLNARGSGTKLTNRLEIKHMMRTKKDLINFLPAVVYFMFPFTKYTLPVILRKFPSFLPTTLMTDDIHEAKLEILSDFRTKAADQVIDSFEKQLNDVVARHPTDKNMQAFSGMWKSLKSKKESSYINLTPMWPYFRDHGGLAFATKDSIKIWTRFLGLGKTLSPDASIYRWADWILTDNQLLKNDGITGLTDFEVYEALEERGFINLDSLKIEYARIQLWRHVLFTQMIRENAEKHAKMKKIWNGEKYVMDELDVCAAAAMMILARALSIVKVN